MNRLILGLLPFFFVVSCTQRDYQLFSPDIWFPEEVSEQSVAILENTSPLNVLKNLETSYNHRRYDIYEALLAKDYRFYMAEASFGEFNAGGNITPPDPAVWTEEKNSGGITIGYYQTREQDLNTIRKMFDRAGRAKELELFFHPTALDTSQADTAYFRISSILLRVTLRDDPDIFVATGDAELTLTRDSQSLWGIWRWEDQTDPYKEG